jgi:Domain of unknown function (DUF202)
VPRDPGLQPERTRLAWQRTGVATVLVGSGAALSAAHRDATGVLLLALAACVLVGVASVLGGRAPVDVPYGRLVLGALATIAVAVVGVVLAVT